MNETVFLNLAQQRTMHLALRDSLRMIDRENELGAAHEPEEAEAALIAFWEAIGNFLTNPDQARARR